MWKFIVFHRHRFVTEPVPVYVKPQVSCNTPALAADSVDARRQTINRVSYACQMMPPEVYAFITRWRTRWRYDLVFNELVES